jgi:uncharacterized protein YceH (UPF0502 family)
MIQLSVVEARVAGSLMEKEITTPEYYPLSLNATVNACNQKSSREPVMQLTEADVRTALFELTQSGLVRTVADTRVSKFEHRMRDALNLRRDEVAVVCLLLLRGPQTPAELRARAERMYSFDDNAAVLATLERLAGREEPVTILMARLPGAREARWAHLLSGPVDVGSFAAAEPRSREGSSGGVARVDEALQQRVELLEEMVLALEERLKLLEDCGVFSAEPASGSSE